MRFPKGFAPVSLSGEPGSHEVLEGETSVVLVYAGKAILGLPSKQFIKPSEILNLLCDRYEEISKTPWKNLSNSEQNELQVIRSWILVYHRNCYDAVSRLKQKPKSK